MENAQEEEEQRAEKSVPFIERAKLRVFSIFFKLLHNRVTGFNFAALMMMLMFLQMIGFVFNRRMEYKFDDSLYEPMSVVFEYIRIYPALESSKSVTNYWLVFYMICPLMLLYIAMMVYMNYSLKIGKFYFVLPIKVLRLLNSLLFWVGIMPITDMLSSIYKCSGGHHIIVTDMICWEGIHILYIIIFTLLLTFFILVLFLIALFFNEANPYSTDMFARFNTNLELVLTIYRIIVCLILQFVDDEKYQLLHAGILLVGSLYLVYNYVRTLPFVHQGISEVYGYGMVSFFWVSVILSITELMDIYGVTYRGHCILIIIGIVVLIPLIQKQRSILMNELLLNYTHLTIKTEADFENYIFRLTKLIVIQHVEPMEKIILDGIIIYHKTICFSAECPLNRNDTIYLPKTRKTYVPNESPTSIHYILLLAVLQAMFKEYLELENRGARIHIFYSHYLFANIGNIHQALIQIGMGKHLQPSLQENFNMFWLKQQLELTLKENHKILEETSKKKLVTYDLTLALKFESYHNQLKTNIERSTNSHLEFWTHLESLTPDFNTLHKLGLTAIQESWKVIEIWKKLYKINSMHPDALSLYGQYLREIHADEEEGDKLVKKALDLKSQSLDENRISDAYEVLFASDSAVVMMSGNLESQYLVTHTTSGINKLLGFGKNEIIGNDVDILMPVLFRKNHKKWIDAYFQTGKEIVTNAESVCFGYNKSEHIVYVNQIIKPVPSLEEDIQYIALLRPAVCKDYDWILADEFGKIDTISIGVTLLLNLSPAFFKENDIYIQILIPELAIETDLERPFTEGFKEMTMVTPTNFSNILKRNSGAQGREEQLHDGASNMGLEGHIAHLQAIRAYIESIIENIDLTNCEVKETRPLEIKRRFYGSGNSKTTITIVQIGKDKTFDDLSGLHDIRNHIVDHSLDRDQNAILPILIDPQEEEGEGEGEISENTGNTGNTEITGNTGMRGLPAPITIQIPDEEPSSLSIGYEENLETGRSQEELPSTQRNLLAAHRELVAESKPTLRFGSQSEESEHGQAEDQTLRNIMMARNLHSKKQEEEKHDQRDAKSSQSDTSIDSIVKHLRQLRNAVYESYYPQSVKNLICSARFVFLLLIALALTLYIIANNLYSMLSTDVQLLKQAKFRLIYGAGIGSVVRELTLMNPEMGSLDPAYPFLNSTLRHSKISFDIHYEQLANHSSSYQDLLYYLLKHLGDHLNDAMVEISEKGSTYDQDVRDKLNPPNIRMAYSSNDVSPNAFVMELWNVITTIVAHGYSLNAYPLSNFMLNDLSVDLIISNTLNSLIANIRNSTQVIKDHSEDTADKNENTLLWLLLAACAALLFSIIVVFPVVRATKKDMVNMLLLFLEIRQSKVAALVAKCRAYFNCLQGDPDKDNQEEMSEENDDSDSQEHEEADEGQEFLRGHKRKKQQDSRKRKEYIAFNSRAILTFLKFTFFIGIILSYFFLTYFKSSQFIHNILLQSDELRLLTEREIDNIYLYWGLQELIVNEENIFMGQRAKDFVHPLLSHLLEEGEEFMIQHTDNKGLHQKSYNDMYDNTMFSSVCDVQENLSEEAYIACKAFMGGLLQKGMQSANVAYWDSIKAIYNDYWVTPKEQRDKDFLSDMLNNQRLIDNQLLVMRYFGRAFQKMVNELDLSIKKNIDEEQLFLRYTVIIYLFILLMLYAFVWSYFVESTRRSLYLTKCMLGIIPPNIVTQNTNISKFLAESSKNFSASYRG